MFVFYRYGCLFLSTNSACTDNISLESGTIILLSVPIEHRMQLKQIWSPEILCPAKSLFRNRFFKIFADLIFNRCCGIWYSAWFVCYRPLRIPVAILEFLADFFENVNLKNKTANDQKAYKITHVGKQHIKIMASLTLQHMTVNSKFNLHF